MFKLSNVINPEPSARIISASCVFKPRSIEYFAFWPEINSLNTYVSSSPLSSIIEPSSAFKVVFSSANVSVLRVNLPFAKVTSELIT